tara:strand:- start:1849 stop:2124 length:276 start_codon:yes stop_codon:yes gene_type:complete
MNEKQKWYGEGDVLTTLSNRETKPFPKIDCDTNRKCTFTEKRVHKWLLEEATKEAKTINDEWNLLQFECMQLNNLSMSDKDHMSLYLFGEV